MHKNKIALISGGTSGIGLATAKILSEEGWKTVLLGRDKQKGNQAEAEVKGSLFISCDIKNECIWDYTIYKDGTALFKKTGRKYCHRFLGCGHPRECPGEYI